MTLGSRGGVNLRGILVRPAGADVARRPAIVALHGCGGALNRRGRLSARHADWARRWTAAGYVVLFPDSFNPRGYREICTIPIRNRPIRPGRRARDAAAAADWLAAQSFVDPARLALVGWSHGGSTVLWTVRAGGPSAAGRFKVAIAFYPGCRVPARRAAEGRFTLASPVSILIGDADNWTPPDHCRDLARRDATVDLVIYPGAVHGFDSPSSPRRTRRDTGYAGARGVEVGTDPEARAAAIELVTAKLARALADR
ncbi:MAG: dienelactone hydrolase family protein [Hyphomicrobiaceae bacterium]